jgi:hypothetical protein
MKQFKFQIVSLDRIELRKSNSAVAERLDTFGAEGWHIVHVKEDPQNAHDLLIFLERETSSAPEHTADGT